jgi:cyclopropane fatty-acyl-phospholipid synthase-like methyltransferase
MTTQTPERIRWAVEVLDVQPDDRLLEIGCGRGIAVGMVCRKLVGGHLLALDRTEKAVKAAAEHNKKHVDAGKAEFRTQALASASLSGPYDKIFAVNVNLFWVRSAVDEMTLIRRILAPGGTFFLVFEPPTPEQVAELAEQIPAVLAENHFAAKVTTKDTMLCVEATPV